MKKNFLKILAIVLVLASFTACLIACNKNKTDPVEKPSNSETLGTAAAIAANMFGSNSAASAQAAEGSEPAEQGGINIDFGVNGSIVGNIFNGITKETLEYYITDAIKSTECFISQNNVKVEKIASDDADYNNLYTITVSYTDKETNEQKTEIYKLYINATKDGKPVDVDTASDYSFTAALKIDNAVAITLNGTAAYDEDVKGVAFNVAVSAGVTNVNVKTWATEKGSIAVKVNVNVSNSTGVEVKVELGRIAENNYGADIDVNVIVLNSCATNVKLTVTAEKADATHDFKIIGKVKVVVSALTVSVDVNGNATYVTPQGETEPELTLSLSGTASVTTTPAQ